MDLAEPWILQLTMATSPKEIIGCFQEMTNRVQYAMKLNKPKVIMAGDSQLSVSYFLIARQRLRNLSSLLKYESLYAASCRYVGTNDRISDRNSTS